ncbi:MAG: hypothetical protein ABI488_10150 [Polyangiaceae bacterium]
MISPTRVAACALLLAVGCARGPESTPLAPSRTPPPARLAAPLQPEFRGYRLATSFVDKGPFRDGAPLRRGVLVGGLRVRTDASGLRLSQTIADPPLEAGVRLPDAQGGGLLFWNHHALYTADTFLGTLQPLVDVGFEPEHVSFGPTFVLVRGGDGRRLAINLQTRQRTAIAPLYLADIASSADGRALALLEGGGCASSDDAGKSYHAVELPAGEHALSVTESNGSLRAALSSGAQIRLERGAAPVLENAPPRAPPALTSDSLWPLALPPLEQALRFGAPLGDEFAGVAVAGSVATVNLRTGELVQVTRALVPSTLACRTLGANATLLVACSSHSGSVLLSDVFGGRPQVQAQFPEGVPLAFAEGVFVAAARCDGQVQPGAVCVRDSAGALHDLSVAAALAKLDAVEKSAGKSAPLKAAVSYWVPQEGGGAVAVVNGAVNGLLDARTGNFVPFAADVPKTVLLSAHTPDGWLELNRYASRDGSVRLWQSSSAVAIDAQGRVEPSVYQFTELAAVGAHALASDRGGHMFQTSDWGRSWVETLAPPGSGAGKKSFRPLQCSQVGCVLGPWLRVGWLAEVPATFPRAKVVAAPSSVSFEPAPLLTCTPLGAPVQTEVHGETRDPAEGGGLVNGPAFGAQRNTVAASNEYQHAFVWSALRGVVGSGDALGLRAGMVSRVLEAPAAEPPPKAWPGFAQSKRFTFVTAFDPSAALRTASISWRTLFDATAAAGAEHPSLDTDQAGINSALPVLGRNPGQSEGLLLGDAPPIWLHEAGSAEPVSLGHAETVPLSAAARDAHTLDVLAVNPADGAVLVSEVQSGKARLLFRVSGTTDRLYPGNSDALAISATGNVAVLRTPSAAEPASSADPALLIQQDGSITPLAPWSHVLLANAPECKPAPSDYRSLLQTSRAWLHLVEGGQPVADEQLDYGMFAIVRVNAERVCLEAVELADAPFEVRDNAFATRVSARFVGARPGAARLGFEPGFEFRQPVSCTLSGSLQRGITAE